MTQTEAIAARKAKTPVVADLGGSNEFAGVIISWAVNRPDVLIKDTDGFARWYPSAMVTVR